MPKVLLKEVLLEIKIVQLLNGLNHQNKT